MNQQEMKIIPPEGYEVDKENSTFECIKFKPIKPQLPKTWEEFCETHPRKAGEASITLDSNINTLEIGNLIRNPKYDKYLLPSREYAEAMLALCQLIQLRDCYNGSWRPDWHLDKNKYCIYYNDGKIVYTTSTSRQFVLAFETSNLREEFYKNFVGLINRAKLLL
jgi:hypothetical protein